VFKGRGSFIILYMCIVNIKLNIGEQVIQAPSKLGREVLVQACVANVLGWTRRYDNSIVCSFVRSPWSLGNVAGSSMEVGAVH